MSNKTYDVLLMITLATMYIYDIHNSYGDNNIMDDENSAIEDGRLQ